MKRLAALWVILFVLGLSTGAYGDVLVYNLYGVAQTVDTVSNDGDTKVIRGYMVLDVNEESSSADASYVVFYGRNGRSRIYTFYEDIVVLTKYGNYLSVMMDTGTGNSVILTGRIGTVRIGPRRQRLRLNAANSLSGAISLQWSTLFDLDESLVGAGALRAYLNQQLTRNVYASPDGLEEAVDDVLANLEARGYQYLSPDDEGPPDDEEPPDDENPPLLR